MTRSLNFQDAKRQQVKGKLALAGATGSGKTWTALTIATVLAGPNGSIAVIDTEKADDRNGAATLYADQFKFQHLEWEPPYNPQELSEALLKASRQFDVVIVDSVSHFWTKEGGTLDIAGGKFTGWKVARPAQEDLLSALQGAASHVIFCMRSKMEFVQEQDPRTGKHTVRKLGMAPIQSDDLAYEFTVMADIDSDHRLEISKSRASTLAGRSFPANHADRFAQAFKQWLDEGEPQTAGSSGVSAASVTRSAEPDSKTGPSSAATRDTSPQDSPGSAAPAAEGDGGAANTLPAASPDALGYVDEFTIVAWRNMLGQMDQPTRDVVRGKWLDEYGRLADGRVKKSYEEAVNQLIGGELTKLYDKNRKHVNTKMKEVGVTTDDARHELIEKATKGKKNSTGKLSAADTAAVIQEVEALRLADGAA